MRSSARRPIARSPSGSDATRKPWRTDGRISAFRAFAARSDTAGESGWTRQRDDRREKNAGYSGVGTAPAENHVLLHEDEPSACLREGNTWKLKEAVGKGDLLPRPACV